MKKCSIFLGLVVSLTGMNYASAAGGIKDPAASFSPAALPLQEVGDTFKDPVFKTTLRRVSSVSEGGGFETQIYSQLQAFSIDNAYVLLASSGNYLVRRVEDLAEVQGLDTSSWNCPRWHPVHPHVIVHYDSNADTTVRVQYTNVDTRETTTVYTFPAKYQFIRVNQSFDELSRDGRWMSGMLTDESGGSVIFTVDLQKKTLGAELALSDLYGSACEPDPIYGEIEPDWIGVSPLGRYLVIQWPRDNSAEAPVGCGGLETYDMQTGAFAGYVGEGHQHGDLGIMPDGKTEFFMGYELYHPSGNLSIGSRLLPGKKNSVSQPNYLLVFSYDAAAGHISCQGPAGTALVSFGTTDESNGSVPFEGELVLLNTDKTLTRLVHHRSSGCGYWVQPRASISLDGRYVIFASDWGTETGTNSCGGGNDLGSGDPYILDLRAGDKLQPDLLIKRESAGSFAANNVYQTSPSGPQVVAQETVAETPAIFNIRIQNDLKSKRGFVLKGSGAGQDGWELSYWYGSKNITQKIRSKYGWATGELAPGQNRGITARLTPGSAVPSGSVKEVVVRSFLDNSDKSARDAVKASATAQ